MMPGWLEFFDSEVVFGLRDQMDLLGGGVVDWTETTGSRQIN